MKSFLQHGLLILIVVLFYACSAETETHTIETPALDLEMTGPLFQGPNTATATWEYSLKELFPQSGNEIDIEDVRITTIKISPKDGIDYPELGKVIMEMKPKNSGMSRIALLESNFDTTKTNLLSIAEIQEDFDEAFEDERLTFVADFDMISEEYFDDLSFGLVVTFEIEIEK